MSESTPAQIVLKGVCRVYRPEGHPVQALTDINLTIQPGEFVCLAGPSGSGKSTLLHLLGALDQPTSGSILMEGRDITRLNRREGARFRRGTIGFVFQSFNLIPVLTAYENVEYSLLLQGVKKGERQQRVGAMLAMVGIADLAGRRVTELSGGQQQRVAVARALVAEPRLVLADEPTGNLDSANGEAIISLLRRINQEQNTTVLYSSHDPRFIARAERVIELADGRISSGRQQAPR